MASAYRRCGVRGRAWRNDVLAHAPILPSYSDRLLGPLREYPRDRAAELQLQRGLRKAPRNHIQVPPEIRAEFLPDGPVHLALWSLKQPADQMVEAAVAPAIVGQRA